MRVFYLLLAVLVTACSGNDASSASTKPGAVRIGNAFTATPVADFQEPWAMAFLPDGRLLVTEKKGALKLLDVNSKRVGKISGVPEVAYGGQGGFGDVILHPQYATNSIVYVSYSEPGDGPGESNVNGAAVARARLQLDR
ncbi:MAG TPA: PQQ-dependent sugar dehydrogenase, partial [Steroidobacteraceae bacterium]|nr:PQQ-dependent sugar dehydrogenase [Steroidobacteraceae bacterium]